MNIASIHTIPIDVFRDHVMPYTYCPQSTSLCDDIHSYNNIITTIGDVYRSSIPCGYNIQRIPKKIRADIKRWLNSVINDYLKALYGVQQRQWRYSCGRRLGAPPVLPGQLLLLQMMRQEDAVASYIDFYERVDADIRAAVGLLTPAERLDLEEFLYRRQEIDVTVLRSIIS